MASRPGIPYARVAPARSKCDASVGCVGITTTRPPSRSSLAMPPASRARAKRARAKTALCAATVSLAAVASPLVAQAPVLSARSLVESSAHSGCALAMTNHLAVGWEAVRVGVVSAPMGTRAPVGDAGATRIMQPVVTAAMRTPTVRGWQLNATAVAGAAASRCASQSRWSRAWLQVAREIRRGGVPRGGVALSMGGKSLSALDPSRDREGLTASLWQEHGSARVGLDIRARTLRTSGMTWFTRSILRPDSVRADSGSGGWVRFNRPVTINDSARMTQSAQAVDLRTRWQQRMGRATFDVSIGGTRYLSSGQSGDTRPDSTSATANALQRLQLWARADARLNVGRSVQLLIGMAALPAQPSYAVRASRVFSLGLSVATGRERDLDEPALTSGREEFTVERLPADSTVIASTFSDSVTVMLRLHRPRAQRVELSGEPFGWRPIAMQRQSGGWWSVPVRVRAGTYRLSVRINGDRWLAPPGLPALRDEFGGESALVTIR